MIELEGLCKSYTADGDQVAALQDVDLRIGTGECFGLFGPSGSGKTTLLRCIAGLEIPDRGVIRIGGVEVYNAATETNLAPWRRPVGVVFQDYALWPHMRVIDNVMFPLRHGRQNALSTSQKQELANGILAKVGLGALAARLPSELSGGQRQRVALARALVAAPSVLLMDEPFSSLDPHLRKETRNELGEILERSRITTVFVSHDHVDGLFMTSSVGIMRDGRVVQVGQPVDVFTNPCDSGVARSLDAGAVFRCSLESSHTGELLCLLIDAGQSLTLPANGSDERLRKSQLLIRTKACRLVPPGENHAGGRTLAGNVAKVGYTPLGWCVLVRVGGVAVEVWTHDKPRVRSGEIAHLAVDPAGMHLF